VVRKVRLGLGFFAGGLILLSSVAHSVLGWSVLRGALEEAAVAPDLVLSLGIGWRLGGAAMASFGFVVLVTMRRLWGGVPTWTLPAATIGAVYLVYGSWAWVVASFDPFFFALFVVPGALVASAVRVGPEREGA
jgi:hypothetical protein